MAKPARGPLTARRLAVGGLFIAGLFVAHLLNSPIPADHKEPWKLRLYMVPWRFIREVFVPVARYVYADDMDTWMGLWRRIEDIKTPLATGIKARDLEMDGVPVRIFVPESGANSTAALVFIHGGGWALHSVDSYGEVISSLSLATGMTVVAVKYRLAPKHRYPAAFEDCEIATKYLIKNADKFGVDPNRIAVIGDSSGGNLAAAVALRLRDDKFRPPLRMQVLIHPALQAIDLQLPSYIEDSCPFLRRKVMVSFWLWYALGTDKGNAALQANNHTPAHIKRKYADVINRDMLPKNITDGHHEASMHDVVDHELWGRLTRLLQDPYFSPGVEPDLRNLPMAFMFTVGHDPLRDEGIIYAKRLQKAGNRVKHVHYPNSIHSTVAFSFLGECQSVREEIVQYIVDNL